MISHSNSNMLLLDKVIYISRKINSFYALPELLESIMETSTEIIGAEAASVLLLDEEKKNLVFYTVIGDKKELIKQFSIPAHKGIAGYSVQNQVPVIVNDVRSDSRFYKEVDEKANFNTKNIMAYPLIVKGEVIGVLEVINSLSSEGFSEKDLKTLSYITELSSLAIYNRVLYDNLLKSNKITTKRVDELNALYSLLSTFSMSMDEINLRDIFKKATQLIRDTLDCRRVSIFLKESSENSVYELISFTGFTEELKEGDKIILEQTRIMKMVEKIKKPLYVLNKSVSNFSITNISEKYSKENFISLPILCNNEPIGFINVAEKNTDSLEDGFDDFDFSLIKSIAISLGNIYNQYQINLENINRKLINKELENAALLQKKMLLQNFSQFKQADIYGFNIPARNVSGDFYGAQKVSQEELAVYIGDVSGKGLPAAFFMATANTSLKEKIRFYKNPSAVIQELNNTLFSETQDGMFITLAYFLIHFKNKKISYAFAGHNNQLFYHSDIHKIELIKATGKPIGIIPDLILEEKTIDFQPGDVLLLCTDGVTEALVDNNEEEGENLLKELLKANHKKTAFEIATIIKNAFLRENEELFDDFTLLVIKF